MNARTRSIHELGAIEVRDYLLAGGESPEVFHEQLGRFTAAADEQIRAFAHRDERVVALQAEYLGRQRAAGELPGPLFGVPVAVKDIFDTVDHPTEYGSPIHAGRYAVADATVVARLRAAGAVIAGKTVTTEFATTQPGPTRNPHNPRHTPGGSSSGSAAAVAAGMVPLALGSQTNGSMIRPASFCGVYAFKPSFGLLPRSGVLEQSPSLDQLGIFGRSIADLALAAEVMSGDDGQDAASARQPPRRLHEVAVSEPPLPPRFCFVRTPWWDQMEPEGREACEAFLEVLGEGVEQVELPTVVLQAVDWHARINEVELAFCLRREWLHSRQALSAALQGRIERALAIPVMDYLAARERVVHVRHAFDEIFERYDGILTPAALGAAPEGLGSTGNPIMQTVWTFAGLPSLNLPLLQLSGGLPLGVQAVGAFGNDARLLRSCRWLAEEFVRRAQA